jgi:hypothetical protein
MQYPTPWKDLPPETKGMVKRMSGRVSGLLDDLSDAMSLLHDLMPSRTSEQVCEQPSARCCQMLFTGQHLRLLRITLLLLSCRLS